MPAIQKAIGWIVGAAVVAVAILYLLPDNETPRTQTTEVEPPAAPLSGLPPIAVNEIPAAPAAPADDTEVVIPPISEPEPIPEAAAPAPGNVAAAALPPLDASDAEVTAAVAALNLAESIALLLQPEDFIRRAVVTLDNLPRDKVGRQMLPLVNVDGRFDVEAFGDQFVIGADNASRYQRYVRLVEAVDARWFEVFYATYYPLFQAAYDELGNPEVRFHDRLLEVIDHLLASPELSGRVALVQPKVMYEFADPVLQARSAGQKLMIRMGPENARRVKNKLREIRGSLVELSPSLAD